MVKRLLSLLLLLLPAVLAAETVTVSSQADFDVLSARITTLAKSGAKEITVRFAKGTYQFKENQLEFKNLSASTLRLSLECEGAVFIPADLGSHSYGDVLLSLKDLSCKDRLSAPIQVKKRPEIVNRKSGLCRVMTGGKDLTEKDANGLYVILTQWYRSGRYPVQKIQGGYIYFTAQGVTSDGDPNHDIDADFKFEKVLPRYSLLDSRKAPANLHRGTACKFLTMFNCYIGSFRLHGARFLSNGGEDCLMQFYANDATSIEVSGCQFEHIHSDIIHVQRTNNFLFRDNDVEHSWRQGITVDYFSSGAEFADNRFTDTGLLMENSFCLQLRGGHFLVHGNVFKDFTYGAVGIGTHWKDPMPASASGVMEKNELFCTPSFNRYLMDSGAVYTWTINRDVTIRDNYIHDIGGYGQNRGIFCDDGTVNVHIVGNRVLRIRNFYCIDLRKMLSIESDPASAIRKVNVGNTLENNTVDGDIRFWNRDE